MVIIIPTSPGLIFPGEPYLKPFPEPVKPRVQDTKPYSTFKIHHDVEGLIEFVHFIGPTLRQYPFLKTANEILAKLEVTTIFDNPDDVSDEDYEYLKTQRIKLEKALAEEVGMQPASYKKTKEALRLATDEIRRLTPEPVQRFKKRQ